KPATFPWTASLAWRARRRPAMRSALLLPLLAGRGLLLALLLAAARAALLAAGVAAALAAAALALGFLTFALNHGGLRGPGNGQLRYRGECSGSAQRQKLR